MVANAGRQLIRCCDGILMGLKRMVSDRFCEGWPVSFKKTDFVYRTRFTVNTYIGNTFRLFSRITTSFSRTSG